MQEPKGHQNNEAPISTFPDPKGIKSLISELGNKNKDSCRNASKTLLSIGEPAVQPLVEALANPDGKIRWEAGKLLDEIDIDWIPYANTKTITELIDSLGSQNGFERLRARRFLVLIGTQAVQPLIQTLSSKEDVKRWEAAKTLSQIGDPSATDALVKALSDNNFDVRWLAAEGLIFIGEPALVSLLRELNQNPDSERLREATHRILHGLTNEKLDSALRPVLHALEDPDAHMLIPLTTRTAISSLSQR